MIASRVFLVIACLAFLSAKVAAQFVITEFMANNVEDIIDEDGNHEDWIEIYNSGLSAASLNGWYLTDNAGQLRKWAFPDKTLQPGQYVVVFASNKDRRNPLANLHTNFKLDAGEEFLGLTKAEAGGGTTVVQSWNPYPPQAADVSYGAVQTGSATSLVTAGSAVKWLVPNATTGPAAGTAWRGEGFNDTTWSNGVAALGISGTPAVIGAANLQHRYNTTTATLGYDSSGLGRNASNSGAAFLASDTDASAAPLKRTGLMQFAGAENDQMISPANAAYDAASSTVCFWMRANLPTGAGNSGAMLWDRRPDYGTAGIVIIQTDDGKIYLQSNSDYCSFGNAVSVSDNVWHHVAATMNTGAGQAVRLYVDGVQVATANNSAAWGWTAAQAIELGRSHDSYWKRYTGLLDDVRFYNRILSAAEIEQIASGADTVMGTSLFNTTGVDAADVSTTLSGMASANPSAFVRIPFTVADPAALGGVRLTVRFCDGYAAWINGTAVAAFNAPVTPLWNSAATAVHDPGRSRVSTLSIPASAIHSGTNVVAIQILNNTVSDPNVLLRPVLEGFPSANGAASYLVTPTPGTTNSTGLTAVGPHISNTTNNPLRPVGGAGSATLTISTKVVPVLNPIASVQVAYRVMWGAETLVPMTAGVGGIYTAQIPTTGLAPGAMLRWRIVATDTASTPTTDPLFIDLDGIAGADTDQYYGTVALDSGYTTQLPVLHWFVQDPAAADTVTPGSRCSVFHLDRFYDYVSVNLHGQSTQGFPKKSYNLGFNKDNRFKWAVGEKEIRSVNLLSDYADKSKLRNTLAYSAWADTRHAASHFAAMLHVRQATGGAPTMAFYGLYDMVEDGNEEFLSRCGLDENGALYKMYNSLESSVAPGAEKKTREFESNADLQALIDGVNPNTRSLSQRRQYVYDHVNIPALINFCAAHSMILNTDWGHKNYYVYRDSLGTKEWFTLPWDQDLCFGHTWIGSQGYFDDEMHSQGGLPVGGGGNYLMSLVYSAPELNAMFVRRMRTLMDQILVSSVVTNGIWDNRVTALIDRIDPPGANGPPETTLIDGINAPCKWLVPAAGNGGFTLTADAGPEQWTNYTDPPNIANWTSGSTGAGYDNAPDYLPLINSNTGAQMFGINATCYVRVAFNIPDAAALANIGTLMLGMKYEDGFRAYINGAFIVGRNDTDASVSSSPPTAVSNVNRDETLAVQFENMDITSAALPVLRVGTNVLAIHCLNAGAGSSDLLMVPKLTSTPPGAAAYLTDADRELQKWGFWTDVNAGQQFTGTLDAATHDHGARKQALRILNANPTPPQTSNVSNPELGNTTFAFLPGRRFALYSGGLTSNGLGVPAAQPASPALVIEQIDFNPASANQDDEFFIIRNNSGASVDLSGWSIAGAVQFTFPGGCIVPAYTNGAENIGLLHVAKSPAAFRVRTSGATGGQYRLAVGPYSGSLSARGETIELRRPDNTLLTSQAWTPAPTAAQNQLRVSELNYSPAPPTAAEVAAIPGVSASDFEFVELVNTGGTALTLSGARFVKGIEFTFPLGATLAAGARVVLVSNQPAFQYRYGLGVTIGGQYQGNLSNSGDTLQLLDAQGEEVLEFHYEPGWFPQSDGLGHTLVTRNASPGWADYGTPSAPLPAVWALSAAAGGTPGAGDADFANGYEGWRFNYWTLSEVSAIGAPVNPAENADGDPMTNFAEYCFGRNPRVADASALSQATVVNVSGTNYPAVTFTRRHLAVDVTWSVQESGNLAAWATTCVLTGTQILGNGLELVTYRSVSAADGTPRFFRVVANK